MLKKLFSLLFNKLENERNNDKKTKNGNAIYFVEEILEKKYGLPNYISSRSIKGYYDKYVEEKENNTGEPSAELKNLISKYLGYTNFLDFENNNISIGRSVRSPRLKIIKRAILVALMFITLFVFYFTGIFESNNCVVWKTDHYEKINCEGKSPNLLLQDINIEKFKKVKISDTTVFFVNNHPVIWYGKSSKGEMEYFNSRGVHPSTLKELKPITKHIINKYIYEKE
ncbi:hypothetical protein [Lutibacter sp.]